jgi:hypothetical protein
VRREAGAILGVIVFEFKDVLFTNPLFSTTSAAVYVYSMAINYPTMWRNRTFLSRRHM